MERIFENPSTFAVIAGKIDGNFLSVANSLHRFAYPTHTVKGFAINDPDEAPTTGDAYVVSAAGTVWGLSVVANDVIYWNGTAWVKSHINLVDIESLIIKKTGNETIAGIKTFTDGIVGSVTGNASTVTNGVYTSGNQTIGGVKTFTSSPVVPDSTLPQHPMTLNQGVSSDIQKLKQINPSLIFQGYVSPSSVIPSVNTANHCWIVDTTGVIFGINAMKGDLIIGTKTGYTNQLFINKVFASSINQSDLQKSRIQLSDLSVYVRDKGILIDSNQNVKKYFFTFLRNNSTNSIIRIGDSVNSNLCQYGGTPNKSGIETVTLKDQNNSGFSAKVTINWDALLGYSYDTLTIQSGEIDGEIIQNAIITQQGISPILDKNVSITTAKTKAISSIIEFSIIFQNPEHAFKINGELRQFYIDYIRNTTSSLIRIQEVGNIDANNGVTFYLDTPKTGIQNITMRQRKIGGFSVKMKVDFDKILNVDFTFSSNEGLINKDIIEAGYYLSLNNAIGYKTAIESYNLSLSSVPNFKTKITAQNEDVNVLLLGDSLFAKTAVTGHYDEDNSGKNLPPHTTRNAYHWFYEYIVRNKPIHDRFDSGFFTETGVWSNSTNGEFDTPLWAGEFRENGSLTRKSTDANASFSFAWDLGQYEKLNLIHRMGVNGTPTATVSVSGGTGLIEVFNGTDWVEANGFVINQYINPTVATDGSGMSQNLGNWRTLFRRKAGATGSNVITISKGNNPETLYYWGTERYNGVTILTSNIARAGRRTYHFQRNMDDLIERNPDLVLFELPLINEIASYTSVQEVLNTIQDYIWGDRVGFENLNSLKNLSQNWTLFEVLLIIPNYSSSWFSGNTPLNLINYTNTTAVSIYNSVKNLILSKNDLRFIDMSNIYIQEGRKRGRSIELSHSGNTSVIYPEFYFNYDSAHPNVIGSKLWGLSLGQIFDGVI